MTSPLAQLRHGGSLQVPPKSHIEMAMAFAFQGLSGVCGPRQRSAAQESGRSLQQLRSSLKDKVPLEASLEQLLDECNLLCGGNVKVREGSLAAYASSHMPSVVQDVQHSLCPRSACNDCVCARHGCPTFWTIGPPSIHVFLTPYT
jgi:hypothetical protein